MTIIGFPAPDSTTLLPNTKTLKDWPWDTELGKPTSLHSERIDSSYAPVSSVFDDAKRIASDELEMLNRVASSRREANDLARYKEDKINAPKHYTSHPSGIECRDICRHFPYNIGTAIAYLWRCDLKNGIEDIKKAINHLEDEVKWREKAGSVIGASDAGC